MTMVSTEFALSSPSSQVRKRTPPSFHALVARIVGTVLASQASATAVEQSWPSLHSPGVIHTKRGTSGPAMSGANCVKGTTWAGQALPYYANGLCFSAYG